MAERTMLRVIAYDVGSDKRRARLAARLEAVAVRVQQSVFEARMTEGTAKRLFDEAKRIAGPGASVRMYTIPDRSIERCRSEGGPVILSGARYWMF